jgi:DNA adenine methylase
MNCLKSPVNRMGGKYYLTGWITQYIPEHTCYVEPFCGAGHLLFSKLPSRVEVLNDIDGFLIGFFRLLKDDMKILKLTQTLDNMLYSRELWQEIRKSWKQGNIPVDEIERVSQWFYLNRTCFSGDQRRGGFAVPSVTGRNPCTSFRNTIKTLDDVAERLRGVVIENLPYAEVIRRYDSKDTLFYCDPPYLNTGHYYGDRFTQDDHCKLNNFLHNVQAKVMLSHYECDTYNQLYHDWNKYTYESFKGAYKAEPGTEKPKTTEVLYCNFEPDYFRLCKR